MTRFARAKGSKSSNLKEPDDSTPWEVMKEQLLQTKKESEENKNRQEAEAKRIENYSNFLKEQKVLKRKATWCDFPEEKAKEASTSEKNTTIKKKKKNKQKKTDIDCTSEPSHKGEIIEQKINGNDNTSKKKKNTNTNIPPEAEPNPEERKTDKVHLEPITSKKKKKKKTKTNIPPEAELNPEEIKTDKEHQEPPKEGKVKKKKTKQQQMETSNVRFKSENPTNKQTDGDKIQNPKKKRGDQPNRRKEINDRSFQLIINGKEIELMRYDGFPIMKKDAERLKELRDNMIKKGIPKSEVNRTIKLERRRAEKALARLKRDVCYNCRKGGHNLSDCPELKSNIPGVDAADGICFKCGSTEHRQFECKVQRDKEFRFANCFICKEQGHIARQCPDNPKGLYPNGGCCKLCGDVTHLRKDCPTVQNKEGTSIKLHTLETGSNIEDIELQSKPILEEAPKKPKKIKF